MGDANRFAILVVVALVAIAARSGGASTGHRVVVAWDTPAIQGRVAALDAAPPYAFTTPELAVGADGLVRAALGRVFHLSRTSGVITVIGSGNWTPTKSFALGAGSEPRDIAVIDANTAYVSRRGARYLWRLDLASGAKGGRRRSRGARRWRRQSGDGHDARARGQVVSPARGRAGDAAAALDRGDRSRERDVVDADPAKPGIQGIALVGTGPRFKMQRVPGANGSW